MRSEVLAVLLVTFRSGDNLYAIDARRVVEVVPRVVPRAIPHAPEFVLGLLNYRARVVPLVDFGLLTGAGVCRNALSTRVIVADYRKSDGRDRLVALVAEEVNRVRNADAGQFVSAGMDLETAPYLGAVVRLDEGLVQLIEIDRLLTDRVDRGLYGGATESA